MNNQHSINMKFQPFPQSTLSLALLAMAGPLLAQGVPPGSGQVLRDLQQTAREALPGAPALRRIEETEDADPAATTKVQVKTIVITGNQELPTAELRPLLANLEGSEQPLAALHAAARRITRYYREHGFAVARAFLPAQDVVEGRISITVVEGRISSHQVNNQSLLSDARVNAFLAGVKDGSVVRSADIDRGLLLLQDTPGVGASRATLLPGASPGTSELLVDVQPSAPYSGYLSLDNHGSRYTGEYRTSGAFTLASPLRLGDQLGFSGLTSGDGLSYARISYQLPIGSSGLRAGLAYFDVRYRLGREFAPLLAQGSASSTTMYASWPFIRSQFSNLNGTLAYEDKKTVDKVNSTATLTGKHLQTSSLGLSGNLQDALGGGGFNSLDLSLVTGRLSIESAAALALDAASARSNGSYDKIN